MKNKPATMDNIDRLLEPVFGFLSLGLNREAWDELDNLPPEFHTSDDVIGIRVNILQDLGQWQEARVMAESMARQFPEAPHWWLLWADSQRQETSIEDARAVLEEAASLHPDSACILFSRACFACAAGDTVAAARMLDRALALDPQLRDAASNEPDLARIFI